jgi:uncharacterized membrane protein
MEPLSVKEVISRAWRTFVDNWGTVLGVLAVVFVLNIAFGLATDEVGEASMGGMLITMLSIAVSIVVQLGMYRIWLDMVRGKQTEVSQLFNERALALRYFGATLIYALIVLVGLVLFIVPGIILAIRHGYYGYAMVDQRLGVRASLEASATLTEGSKGKIFLLALAIAGIVVVSIIPLGLGLIASVPMAMVSGAVVYEMLRTRLENPKKELSDTPVSEESVVGAPAPFVPLEDK